MMPRTMTAEIEADIRKRLKSPSGALTEMLLHEVDAEREVSAALLAALRGIATLTEWEPFDIPRNAKEIVAARDAIAKAEDR
jgi:hypothetical protein